MTTTLVLGAGASKPYGFPLGWELKRDIIIAGPYWCDSMGIEAPLKSQLAALCDIFSSTPVDSIDAFLAARPEFTDAGRLAIAYRLLQAEATAIGGLTKGIERSDLYRTLFHQLVSLKRWEDVDFSEIKIVTFNYERSLEFFLMNGLRSYFGKTEEEVLERLETLEVVHIYGDLGKINPKHVEQFVQFGQLTQPSLHVAANSLLVIPQARDSEATMLRAREILKQSQRVAILGFAFDPMNVQRLGGSETLFNCVERGGLNQTARPVFSTCMGLTSQEAIHAASSCGIYKLPYASLDTIDQCGLPPNFLRIPAEQMLRESMVLTRHIEGPLRQSHLLS